MKLILNETTRARISLGNDRRRVAERFTLVQNVIVFGTESDAISPCSSTFYFVRNFENTKDKRPPSEAGTNRGPGNDFLQY